MKVFTSLPTVDEAVDRFLGTVRPQPRGSEIVRLEHVLGRITAQDLVAPEDLPPFDRSAVDGYAVRCADVAGASAEAPATLRVVGEVRVGEAARVSLLPGQAVRIPTGGMLPEGADAVVMQEHCDRQGERLAVHTSVQAGANVVCQAADVRRGEVVALAGTRIRPQELGLLAGLGIVEVPCCVPPRVAIFSTGDEVVPADRTPMPGQVRDMNRHSLAGQVSRLGAVPLVGGILSDEAEAVERRLRDAMHSADVLLVSGGSSVGARDVLAEVVPRLGAPGVVVHGVAIKPGKPTLLALCDGKVVIGLPGNPVSAMVVFEAFARPVLEAMLGLRPDLRGARRVLARLAQRLRAPADREEFVRVRIAGRGDCPVAHPVLGGSAIITTMTRADGYVRVPMGQTLDGGAWVEVHLFD
ncbi:MAG: molybdopterin molybdotransferase MoeA [Armatimonadota bacterium]|nr:molybdopterin molybdotransferase MoeA [Armatimonadota bacterium]MDR5696460.1 molybdopterin molybdotransferase MoeA [Armatimonadota bacterium]